VCGVSRLPLVAIIGRPNTGKSTLFNKLLGERRAIVSDIPGTTRDHIAAVIEAPHVDYLLIDTGGMGGGTDDKEMETDVEEQSLLALRAADLILFLVNSREELTSSDHKVATLLRKERRRHVPVILIPTKADTPSKIDELVHAYHELGIGDHVIPVSAFHGIGLPELREAISTHLRALHFKKQRSESSSSDTPRIAIVGKPNVGKSSLVNAFMSDTQRKTSPRLVSPVPGTTRDTTDTIIRHKETDFLFLDTAGLRRPAKVEEDIESYATLRTIQAMERADVTVLMLDGTVPISRQDKRIANLAVQEGKGLILVLNKIDLLKKDERKARLTEIQRELFFCRFAPVLPVSTVTRDGLLKLFDLIEKVSRNRLRRIPTRQLQSWYRDAVLGQPMRTLAASKFITQAEDPPPTFVLFVKDPKKVQVSQLRFLENNIRKTFGFEGTPVRWVKKASSARR
jgi:GTP-binding protein